MYLFYKRKKNKLGQQLGFDIPKNCVGKGLLIHHVGNVTINGDARIGENCEITGNVCIGYSSSGAPVVGNNVTFGYGSTVIGGINIADNCVIGAGAVVTKSEYQENQILIGVPARRLEKDENFIGTGSISINGDM